MRAGLLIRLGIVCGLSLLVAGLGLLVVMLGWDEVDKMSGGVGVLITVVALVVAVYAWRYPRAPVPPDEGRPGLGPPGGTPREGNWIFAFALLPAFAFLAGAGVWNLHVDRGPGRAFEDLTKVQLVGKCNDRVFRKYGVEVEICTSPDGGSLLVAAQVKSTPSFRPLEDGKELSLWTWLLDLSKHQKDSYHEARIPVTLKRCPVNVDRPGEAVRCASYRISGLPPGRYLTAAEVGPGNSEVFGAWEDPSFAGIHFGETVWPG